MHPAQAPVQEQAHAQAQPLSLPAANRDKAGCFAEALIQSQIDTFQKRLVHLAVAPQIALAPAEHCVNAITFADINALKVKQFVFFKRFTKCYKISLYNVSSAIFKNN